MTQEDVRAAVEAAIRRHPRREDRRAIRRRPAPACAPRVRRPRARPLCPCGSPRRPAGRALRDRAVRRMHRLWVLRVARPLGVRGGTPRSTESGEAPAWQGATREHIGHIRPRSNAAHAGCIAARMQRCFCHGLLGAVPTPAGSDGHDGWTRHASGTPLPSTRRVGVRSDAADLEHRRPEADPAGTVSSSPAAFCCFPSPTCSATS